MRLTSQLKGSNIRFLIPALQAATQCATLWCAIAKMRCEGDDKSEKSNSYHQWVGYGQGQSKDEGRSKDEGQSKEAKAKVKAKAKANAMICRVLKA